MAITLIPGKVYIRNPANGRVYEYEKNLASMSGFEQFTAEEPKAKNVAPPPPQDSEPDGPDGTADESPDGVEGTANNEPPAPPAPPAPKKPAPPAPPKAKGK